MQAVIGDLVGRGVRAIEAFGAATNEATCSGHSCITPVATLEAAGFSIVAPHAQWPRLRLELTEGLMWKAGVEAALDQLLAEAALAAAEGGRVLAGATALAGACGLCVVRPS